MTRAWWTLPLLLIGCLDVWPGSQPVPKEEVDTVVAVWRDAGMPYGSWCEWQRPMAVWTELDQARAEDACQSPPDQGLQGCILLPQPHILTTEAAPDALVRIHELVHWLDYCSTGHVDYDHSDDTLWSVAADATKLLAR